jgi:hypothetical protein
MPAAAIIIDVSWLCLRKGHHNDGFPMKNPIMPMYIFSDSDVAAAGNQDFSPPAKNIMP